MRIVFLGIAILVVIATDGLNVMVQAHELASVRKVIGAADAIERSIEILSRQGMVLSAYHAQAEMLDKPKNFDLRLTERQRHELDLALNGRIYWLVRIDVLNDAVHSKRKILWSTRMLIDATTGEQINFPVTSGSSH